MGAAPLQKHQVRKLAVILHADIVGSTTLVQRNEALAHDRIRDAFHRFSKTIERYGGVVHETRGDALVAEFPRASDAVSAALRFQALNAEHNVHFSDDVAPVVRVGIALGEEVFADNTVTGTGVVLAQRVEQLSEPGGVCVTGAVQEAIPQRMPFHWENLGEKSVKGFEAPVRVYRVALKRGEAFPEPEIRSPTQSSARRWKFAFAAVVVGMLAAAVGAGLWLKPRAVNEEGGPPTNGPSAQADQPSIAVLPFKNVSGDQEQGYFADGLADDLITDLSKISGLIVIARNSSFAYRGMPGGVQDVASALGVRYLLDGSVRRAGEKVRINAQLVDASTGQNVWSERFDQNLTNIFSIQDEVTKKIVSALQVSLSASEKQRFDRERTANFDAYDMLLRAREIQARFTPEDNAAGRELYAKAAQLDPQYARAYSGVALTHVVDVNMNWTDDRERSIRLGLEAVGRALELDDTLPQALVTRGGLYLSQRRYEDSINQLERAVEIAPNYADGHANLAFSLINAGRHEEGLRAIERAKRLNPRYSQVYLYVEAIGLFHLQRFEEARTILKDAIERNPAFDRPHLLLASTLAHLGQLDEGNWALQEASILIPDLSLEKERRETLLARSADIERYLEGLKRAGLD